MNRRALDHALDYVRSWLRYRSERVEVPGLVVAVSWKGKLLLNEAYGYADRESQTALTPDHIFRIASHSKTFTATSILQLVEQGKLRLDDPVVDHVHWLREHRDHRFRRVTIRQLLSHGAGVIRDGLDADFWQLARPFPDRERFQAELLEADLVIDTNLKLKYSNFGYTILGLVIESASGQTYHEYVTEHIVEPLGLSRTGPELNETIRPQLVTGYTQRDSHGSRLPIPHINTRAMAAATGFYGTGADLCTYFTAHFAGSRELLDDESKKEMQRIHWLTHRPGTETQEAYGLGLDLDVVAGRRTFGHSGGFPGHITRSMADPAHDLVVVALTNAIDGPAGDIARGVHRIIDYFDTFTPDSRPARQLRRLEGRYMSLWGAVDVVVTGDRMVLAAPDSWEPLVGPDVLEAVDATTLKVTDTGSFGSVGELVRFKLEDGRVVELDRNGQTMWPEAQWPARQRRLLGVRRSAGERRL